MATRAKQTRAELLVAVEFAGALSALLILWIFPFRPMLTLPSVAVAMFGIWGISDKAKRKGSAPALRTALTWFQYLVAAAGAVAAAGFIFGAGGALSGTFTS